MAQKSNGGAVWHRPAVDCADCSLRGAVYFSADYTLVLTCVDRAYSVCPLLFQNALKELHATLPGKHGVPAVLEPGRESVPAHNQHAERPQNTSVL